MVCDMFVVTVMQLQLHKHHHCFYGTCVLDSPRCYLVLLDVGVLLLSSCCLVIAWYIYEFFTLPTRKPQT